METRTVCKREQDKRSKNKTRIWTGNNIRSKDNEKGDEIKLEGNLTPRGAMG